MTEVMMNDGVMLQLMRPDPECLSVKTIARHLSRIARYNGATRDFYSVAEHSVRGAYHYMARGMMSEAKSFLFHDAHEALTGDIKSPMKPFCVGLTEVQRSIDNSIEQRFGVKLHSTDGNFLCIKRMDSAMLQREWIDLMPSEWDGPDFMELYGLDIDQIGQCWTMDMAMALYVECYNEL